MGHDDAAKLRQQIEHGLQHDVLVLSGGVSAGVKDLVPGTLESLGVAKVFHKVRIKPGKPLWFGCQATNDGSSRPLVFGLPGNPVSSLVCFQVFVRPALAALSGQTFATDQPTATLATTFTQRDDRPTYHPGLFVDKDGLCHATPLGWHGSSDMRSLAEANCLIFFPAGPREYLAGETVDIYPVG